MIQIPKDGILELGELLPLHSMTRIILLSEVQLVEFGKRMIQETIGIH